MRILIRHGLDRGDGVLKLGDLTQSATGGHPIILGDRQDEIALMRLKAFSLSAMVGVRPR